MIGVGVVIGNTHTPLCHIQCQNARKGGEFSFGRRVCRNVNCKRHTTVMYISLLKRKKERKKRKERKKEKARKLANIQKCTLPFPDEWPGLHWHFSRRGLTIRGPFARGGVKGPPNLCTMGSEGRVRGWKKKEIIEDKLEQNSRL
jgi:hypothetical protein